MNKRTAFITGASRGIGKACAQALAASGCRVVLAARSTEKLEELAGTIRETGGEAMVISLDLAAKDSITAAVAQALTKWERIDVLVNNGGMTKDGLAVRMKQPDWEAVISVNLSGAFYTAQQVLPGMMKERWGRIINIASVVGKSGNAGQANYASSKAGLIGLTKSLALEVGSRNITVNAVAPGFVTTEMTNVLSEELKNKMIERTPLRRFGTPEDVAAAVTFLAGDGASFITGQVLDVSGGIYM